VRGERLLEVDLLRAAALLGVGVIHAAAWVTPAEAPPGQNALAAVSELARFSVPAFVFASGFLLFHAYGHQARQPASFLKRRWLRVLLPWACCVPLFLALGAWQGNFPLQPGPVGQWLASGPGHLYFLILIAQLYLLFLVLPRDLQRLRWATAGLVAGQLGLMAWHSYGGLPQGTLGLPGASLSYEQGPFWMGTFATGCLAAAEWGWLSRIARAWPVAVLGCLAAGGLLLLEGHAISPIAAHEGNAAYLWPSRLPQTIVWCLTLLWFGRLGLEHLGPATKLVEQLSSHSLGIYLLHPIFLELLGPHTSGLPTMIRVPALLALSFAGAYVAVRLLALRPATAAAVGEQVPNNVVPFRAKGGIRRHGPDASLRSA
jgi:probable poly-beta-1,6-N-acetyl-D-glucosamine export protein